MSPVNVPFVMRFYMFFFVLSTHKAATNECDERFIFPEWNIEFNICELQLTPTSPLTHAIPYYKVIDSRYDSDPDIEYEYDFNIASSVLEYPSSLCQELNTGYCTSYTSTNDNATCTSSTKINWLTWGYQQKFNKSAQHTPIECKHLSGNKDDDYLQLELYSNSYPPQGVIINMVNGDYDESCPYNQNNGKNTQFSLILICADTLERLPMIAQINHDPDKCWYWMKAKSIFGCPIECDVYADRLCAGNGICGYDFTNLESKCQCFYGYGSREDCSSYNEQETIPEAAQNALPTDEYSYTFTIDNTTSPPQTICYELNEFYNHSNELNESQFIITSPNDPWEYYIDLLTYSDDSDQLPEACKMSNVGKPCKIFSTDNSCEIYEDIEYGQGVMYRYNEITQICELLATDYDIGLYDEQEPAKGVTINTQNGSYCGGNNSPYNVNRGAKIHLICDNGNNISSVETDIESVVYSDDAYDCTFEMWWETGTACPWVCLTKTDNNQYTVCNLHGSCMFDPFAGYTICKCDNGWEGANCQTKSKKNNKNKKVTTNTIILLLVIGIVTLFVVFCVILIIFWNYYMKLKRKFQKLHGQQLLISDTDRVNILGSSGGAGVQNLGRDDDENRGLI